MATFGQRINRKSLLVFAAWLTVFAPIACSDATGLSTSQVAGDYVATGFRITDDLGPIEILDLGGDLTLNLDPSGAADSTSGRAWAASSK
ncbi:MAG TPA: hypothetical protein VFK13_09400 [Gemmatimonadaceae bacterium]|nr:hypothetical protein [Gemmatimonadaceae bacterium]